MNDFKYELWTNRDGTCCVAQKREEVSKDLAPEDRKQTTMKCTCKKPGYCARSGENEHTVHICATCWGLMALCKEPWE